MIANELLGMNLNTCFKMETQNPGVAMPFGRLSSDINRGQTAKNSPKLVALSF